MYSSCASSRVKPLIQKKKNFNEQINKRHSKYAIKSQYTVTVIGIIIIIIG